jgi:hypothetical protein
LRRPAAPKSGAAVVIFRRRPLARRPVVYALFPRSPIRRHAGRCADFFRRHERLPRIRCAAQRHHRVRIKRNQPQAENACTMRAGTGERGKPVSGDPTSAWPLAPFRTPSLRPIAEGAPGRSRTRPPHALDPRAVHGA